jgi:hypothetical protein
VQVSNPIDHHFECQMKLLCFWGWIFSMNFIFQAMRSRSVHTLILLSPVNPLWYLATICKFNRHQVLMAVNGHMGCDAMYPGRHESEDGEQVSLKHWYMSVVCTK